MRVMIVLKGNAQTESGTPPDEEMLTRMSEFNEELANAGLLVQGEGLRPSSTGARVLFSGKERSVVQGPFHDAREPIAGFWVWRVDSLDQAIEWVKRIPNPTGEKGEIDVRPVWEPEDIPAMTPELRRREEELRARTEARTH